MVRVLVRCTSILTKAARLAEACWRVGVWCTLLADF